VGISLKEKRVQSRIIIEMMSSESKYLSSKQGSLNDDGGDTVRVNIGSRAPVLKVSKALGSDMSRDTDTGATVGNTRAELGDVGGLVLASQPQVVVLSVNGNMFHMPL